MGFKAAPQSDHLLKLVYQFSIAACISRQPLLTSAQGRYHGCDRFRHGRHLPHAVRRRGIFVGNRAGERYVEGYADVSQRSCNPARYAPDGRVAPCPNSWKLFRNRAVQPCSAWIFRGLRHTRPQVRLVGACHESAGVQSGSELKIILSGAGRECRRDVVGPLWVGSAQIVGNRRSCSHSPADGHAHMCLVETLHL